MKKAILASLVMGMISSGAMADGFICSTFEDSNAGQYSIKVFNHTNPSQGTRNGAIMIISDDSVQYGRKTIATFQADKTLIDAEGASYIANVDLRYSDSNRAGENILGTKLGMIDTLSLDLNFSYNAVMLNGEEVGGRVTILKRNGSKLRIDLACTRYLKN